MIRQSTAKSQRRSDVRKTIGRLMLLLALIVLIIAMGAAARILIMERDDDSVRGRTHTPLER